MFELSFHCSIDKDLQLRINTTGDECTHKVICQIQNKWCTNDS